MGNERRHYDYTSEYPTAPHHDATPAQLGQSESSRASFDNVGYAEWYLSCLHKYALLTGRARRIEYLTFTIVSSVFIRSLLALRSFFGNGTLLGWTVYGLAVLYALATMMPQIAVTIRRCHDVNISGLYLLLWLVPVAGMALSLYLAFANSYIGSNRFGPDPFCIDFQRRATKSAPQGWYPDPTGRHQLRFWDSDAWTPHVASDGVVSHDCM